MLHLSDVTRRSATESDYRMKQSLSSTFPRTFHASNRNTIFLSFKKVAPSVLAETSVCREIAAQAPFFEAFSFAGNLQATCGFALFCGFVSEEIVMSWRMRNVYVLPGFCTQFFGCSNSEYNRYVLHWNILKVNGILYYYYYVFNYWFFLFLLLLFLPVKK